MVVLIFHVLIPISQVVIHLWMVEVSLTAFFLREQMERIYWYSRVVIWDFQTFVSKHYWVFQYPQAFPFLPYDQWQISNSWSQHWERSQLRVSWIWLLPHWVIQRLWSYINTSKKYFGSGERNALIECYSLHSVISTCDCELVRFSYIRSIGSREWELFSERFEPYLVFRRRERTEISRIGISCWRKAWFPTWIRLTRDRCCVSPHTKIMHIDEMNWEKRECLKMIVLSRYTLFRLLHLFSLA